MGAVTHYTETLPMTKMLTWIPLSNTISVKKWHIKQLHMFWTLVTTFKLTQNFEAQTERGPSAGHGYRFMGCLADARLQPTALLKTALLSSSFHVLK